MTWFEALLLGIIQGLTEFLPISSSGHLELFQYLLGYTHFEKIIPFTLICHLGTLLSIFCVFIKKWKRLIILKWKQIILATLPLFPLLLLLKPIKQIYSQPKYLSICFFTTALLLYLGQKFSVIKPKNVLKKRQTFDAICIGISQSIAILPGISRSGTTISFARLMGWKENDAVTFSFLLAIPTILGALVVESKELINTDFPSIAFSVYLTGFITSFIVGYFSLLFFIKTVERKKIMGFVWYCVMIGLMCIFCFNVERRF